jgi:alpha-tubulin suppressor-like RCC1 family protein
MHSVFIDVNGNVYAAGNNGNGQLCTGDTSSRDMPVQVLLPGQAVSAAVGADFTLILMATGDVYGCGSNQKGALGFGKSTTQTNSPMLVVTGANTFGQLCLDPSEYDDDIIFIPVLLLDLDIESFKAGYQSSYLLFDDGSVASCGRNDGKHHFVCSIIGISI